MCTFVLIVGEINVELLICFYYYILFAGNETFERLASIGLIANFMQFLLQVFHLDQVSASNVLNIWSGVTNFIPLIGAFISDVYIGRFWTIASASIFEMMVRLFFLSQFIVYSSNFKNQMV